MLSVYAITDRAPLRLGRGASGERLRLVAASGLVVVVGGVDAPPAVSPEALTSHDAVVRRLAARCPALLPARFGWTAADDAELAAAVSPHAEAIRESLRLVNGCVQMNVRLFGKATAAAREDPPAQPLPPSTGPGTRYLHERARRLREAAHLPELAPLHARLAGLLRAQREERQDAGDLVGTAYHLVGRGRVRTYRARAARAAREIQPFRIQISGPWAAYAFGPETLR
jgi:hypothetical protein